MVSTEAASEFFGTVPIFSCFGNIRDLSHCSKASFTFLMDFCEFCDLPKVH